MKIKDIITEDLKAWFGKEKWVRFGPDGKIRGDCARGSSSEGKPKCLPAAKAHALGKKGRASAAAKKRREDPNPERRGAAKNVATKVKEENQNDRNARIIAGEIEDAMSQGNEKLAQEKIKQLIGVGYTLDKQGRLQRMGMYEEEVAEGFNDVAQMVFNGIAMYGFFRLLFRWFKNKALSADERLGLNRDLSSGRNRVYKVYINGKDVSSKILTKNEAFEVIKSMAKETHNPNTHFTIYNTDTKEVEFRHNVGTGESIDEQNVLEQQLQEKQDACYSKVKSRYKVWPSAYASGALVQCRKKGAANWGNKKK